MNNAIVTAVALALSLIGANAAHHDSRDSVTAKKEYVAPAKKEY